MKKRYWYFCGRKKIRSANGSGEGSRAILATRGQELRKTETLVKYNNKKQDCVRSEYTKHEILIHK